MLAGLVQSPTNDDPITQPENALNRRNQVLQRMNTLNHITDQELAEVSAQPVTVVEGADPPNGCIDAAVGAFFCDYLYSYLTGTLGLSSNDIKNGGLTIQTSLRPDMQVAGDQAVLNTLAMGDELVGTYTAVEPGTGKVLAMANNRRYGCDAPECESVNLNVVPSKGSGSTFKVFTAAAALEQGYSKYYTLTTSDPYVSRVYKDGRAPYDVPNAGNYPATLDMEKALYMSSNTYFLALEDALGSVEGPVRMAERMGMHFDAANQYPADQIIAENRGSFTFGTDAVSPLDLASAYSTLAASGTQCDPTPVVSIVDRAGKPLTDADGAPVVKDDNCTPEAIPVGVATTLNQMLRKDVEPGNSGQTASRAYIPGHQIAGKTGTINNNASVAFVGYTPEYTASVLVFNSVADRTVGGFGGGKGATIWHDAMEPILANQPTAEFPAEDPAVANGNTQLVPRCSSVDECESALQQLGFRTSKQQVDSAAPAGTFVGTSPGAGSRANVNQTIAIQVSNGSQVPAPTVPAPPADTGGGIPGGGGGGGPGPGRNND
jgi:membrane peptidoglycan carboxypeptidase